MGASARATVRSLVKSFWLYRLPDERWMLRQPPLPPLPPLGAVAKPDEPDVLRSSASLAIAMSALALATISSAICRRGQQDKRLGPGLAIIPLASNALLGHRDVASTTHFGIEH